MKIDVGTFAQNFKNEVGGTPSWGTSVGQSETLSHKITRQGKEDIVLGMIYRAIDVSKIETEFGKGGNRTEENPIVAAALFDKVFVNGKRVEGGKFILLFIKQVGDNYVEQHYGRLTLKYPSSVVYDGETYNEDIFSKINKTMCYSPEWTWFASDISVISQDELHFRIHCFNKKVIFAGANDKKAKTEELMKNDGVIDPVDSSKVYKIQKLTPKASIDEYVDILKDLIVRCGGKTWDAVRMLGALYHEYIGDSMYQKIRAKLDIKETSDAEFKKGRDLGPFVVSKDLIVEIDPNDVENAAEEELDVRQLILERYHARTDFDIVAVRQKYAKFKSLYSKQALLALDGIDLLKRLFAPKDMDENSLTYNLEHNSYYGEFGGIGGGSQFKYPLYFYSKKQKWCIGPSLKSQTELTEEEAIEKAEEIKTKFIALFDLIESTDLTHVENYALIQNLLNSDSLYRKIWVFKYLHMLYPDKFSTFYSWEWLNKVTKFLSLPEGSSLMMNGEISSFASELRIPNVFLAQIIYELLPSVDDDNIDETNDENENEEEEETMIIELPERSPRTYKKYPLNLVLYGAPGTGKTYSTMELACSIFDRGSASIDDICEGNTHANRAEVMEHYNSLVKQGFITFTTFHQSYGYEDFIQGLRPDDKSESLKFVPVDGVFKKIVNRAIKDQTNNYVIIIDEINRANISKVLGELITLLETDKRWGEINQLSTKLPSGEPFAVPNNLYVIGTMNSADKSISLIDAALRRRFEFVEVSVNYKTIANSTARSVLKKINEKLEGQLDSSDLLVGHAYFIGKDENTICDVLNHNVIPLLYEYFFDNKAKVKDILKYALDGLNYEIEDEAGKRLRVIKKAE